MAVNDDVWLELVKNLIKIIVLIYIIKYLWSILYIHHIMPELVKRKKRKKK